MEDAMPLPGDELRTKVDWGPTVDLELCTGCGVCVDFCHQGVWALVDDTAVVVAKSDCIVGCSHCATLCEAEAISFPTIEELRRSSCCD
jgi:NAD-dependent dihydropyrimidine dehydrogenase PreA subunit